jgi:hypothetical protein
MQHLSTVRKAPHGDDSRQAVEFLVSPRSCRPQANAKLAFLCKTAIVRNHPSPRDAFVPSFIPHLPINYNGWGFTHIERLSSNDHAIFGKRDADKSSQSLQLVGRKGRMGSGLVLLSFSPHGNSDESPCSCLYVSFVPDTRRRQGYTMRAFLNDLKHFWRSYGCSKWIPNMHLVEFTGLRWQESP